MPEATAADEVAPAVAFQPAPGTAEPSKRRRLHYELIGCALHGHALIGTGAARIRPEDAWAVRPGPAGVRWHRCLRCDAWLAVPEPPDPTTDTPPDRTEVELPLRGRPLRDRYVLRLIAVDRAVHVLVLAILTVVIFIFATHRNVLHHDFTKILSDLQGGLGGPANDSRSGLISELNRLFSFSTTKLYAIGVVVAAYTALLAVEMVGLWRGRRWAEYLTFVEVAVLVPFEIYELTRTVTALKILALVINLAVAAYLLFAHRLFGVRGGETAQRARRQRDSGWGAVERATPPAA